MNSQQHKYELIIHKESDEVVMYSHIFAYRHWLLINCHTTGLFCMCVIYSSNNSCKCPTEYAYNV